MNEYEIDQAMTRAELTQCDHCLAVIHESEVIATQSKSDPSVELELCAECAFYHCSDSDWIPPGNGNW